VKTHRPGGRASLHFLQGAGDGFSVLKGGTNVVPGSFDIDALVAYLKSLPGPVAPVTDGRVQQVPWQRSDEPDRGASGTFPLAARVLPPP
jgi:hypothetical protein